MGKVHLEKWVHYTKRGKCVSACTRLQGSTDDSSSFAYKN
jgi:hypothetical protein